MTNLVSSLIVRLVDGASKPAQTIARSLQGLTDTATATIGGRLTAAINRNDAAIANMGAQVAGAIGGLYALKAALWSPVQGAMALESAMADVRKVVDFGSDDAFKAFERSLIDLSRTIPLSVNGLAQIAAAAGQAGIAGDDLTKFTEAAAKIGVAFDISADEAGDAMAKLMTGLDLTIDEAVSLSDAMNHLSNSQASSAAQILEVVRNVGAQAQLYGFTAEQTAAFASAMIAAGSASDVSATSFRNMGMYLTRGASATKRQTDAMRELGLSATDVAKRMQEDAVGTTIDVLERLNAMPAEVQGALASDIFGNEARALGPLLTNLDLLKTSLGLVSDEADYAGSTFNEFSVRADTFENSLQLATNKVDALKISVGKALIPALNDLLAMIGPVVDGLASFASAHPELIRNVALATGALVGFRAAMVGLKFVGLIGKGGALSLMSIGFNSVGKALIGATAAASNAVALQEALAAMSGVKMGGLDKIGASLGGMARAIPGVAPLTGVLTAVAGALGGISAPVWGGIALGVAAVAGAGLLLWKYFDRISAVVGGVAKRIGEELAPAIEFVKPILEPFGAAARAMGDGFKWAGDQIGNFFNWFGQLFQRETLTEDQKAEWETVGYDIIDGILNGMKSMFAGVLQWFGSWPGEIMKAIGNIDISGLFQWRFPWDAQVQGGPDLGNAVINGEVTDLPSPTATGENHRANGGAVWPGGSFIVGDGGEPEVFTPSGSGTITPLSKMSGASIGQIGPFHIAGESPAEIARIVVREVHDAFDELMQGSHADTGVYT